MRIEHLHAGEFLQHGSGGASRDQWFEPCFEGQRQAIGEEGNEDVRLDAGGFPVVDRTDGQIICAFLERLLDLGDHHSH